MDLIWQPELHNETYNLKVYLDRNFAKKMIHSHTSQKKQKRINELANEELKRLGVYYLDPYSFHEDSCFVSQIYIGNNGVWLATDFQPKDDLSSDRAVEYHSHNVNSSKEAYVLMRLFSKWVYYSDVLSED